MRSAGRPGVASRWTPGAAGSPRADHGQCQGYGNCVLAAADTFDHDDDGLVMLLRAEIPEADRARIELAAWSCPVQALAVDDE